MMSGSKRKEKLTIKQISQKTQKQGQKIIMMNKQLNAKEIKETRAWQQWAESEGGVQWRERDKPTY